MRSDLPSGTVTFLFTDVEGSTKLLHELGAEAYDDALITHRSALREAFQRHGGVEVDTQGDAFFYAFPTAPGAVDAAREGMEALSSGPIRVRIGLHTGTPHIGQEGYIGGDVHLGARIAATAHGGQVVLSRETRLLVVGDITDLGEHRLKDIAEAVAIFQLGDGFFPPLKTISNTNLPRPASSFVGRDDELLEVLSRFEAGARLVTLTGPGGTGKTRLAIEAAAELVSEYKAGVFWVGLATLRDPALVTETIAQSLGAKEGLSEHIGERELLLLLDNIEQVIDCAPELSSLLSTCPNLSLLVTSRELLRVQGEVEYAVPPLAELEAVELFCARAQLKPDDTITELCRHLDDMPLAVELAAARTSALTPLQILERISQRLDLLKGGRGVDPRQQTLRATIEWSYELLIETEQQLFARLSVFSGGCALEAAEEVCGADLDTLQSLVEKSLLRFTDGRYWMLETIREYAAEQLARSGKEDESMERLVEFIGKLALQLETTFESGGAYKPFASEQGNFRVALSWAEQAGDPAQHDLIGRSWPFWWYWGHPAEGLRWVASALARSEGEHTERRVKVLNAGAMFAQRAGDLEALKTYAEESLTLARRLADKAILSWSLILCGNWASEVGAYPASRDSYEEAIELARATGQRRLVGILMNNIGVVAEREGDFPQAIAQYEGALAISKDLATLEEATVEGINLSRCLYYVGRSEEAAAAVKTCLVWARDVNSAVSLMDGFVVAGALAYRGGSAERGAKLVGAAEQVGYPIGGWVVGDEQKFFEATVRDLIDELGQERYAEASRQGKAMTLAEAVEYALASID